MSTSLQARITRTLRLSKAYRVALAGEGGMDRQHALHVVLLDLAKFCRARQSTVVVSPISRTVDTHATMLAEGRREVFNRITQYLNLSEDQIMQLQERANEEP